MPFIAMSPVSGVGVAPFQGTARATGRSRKTRMNAQKSIQAMMAVYFDSNSKVNSGRVDLD